MYGVTMELSDEALSENFLIPIGQAKIERPGNYCQRTNPTSQRLGKIMGKSTLKQAKTGTWHGIACERKQGHFGG